MSSTDVVAQNQQTSLVNTPTTTDDDTKVNKAVDVVDEDDVVDVKPNTSFDYCEDIARVSEDATDEVSDSLDIVKEEPALSEEDLSECPETIVPPDKETDVFAGESSMTAVLKREDDEENTEQYSIEASSSSPPPPQQTVTSPPNDDDGDEGPLSVVISPSEEIATADSELVGAATSNVLTAATVQPSDPKSIETFFDAFEEYIRSRDQESQCSYMEAYGFVITFRYVYEQKERDKDTELAINALLARYTGIESLNVLQVFLESLNANGELDDFKSHGLQPVDCILLTYIQLRVCISFRDLAKVFESNLEHVHTCFMSTINTIKKTLGSVIYWPSREETEMTIPKFFKPAYSNVRTIFTNLVVQTNEVYQQRYVIGFAPSGFVSYISNGYNAVVYSDERIFREEKIRQRFERNQDALMVLDGFPIENLLGINNFRVFRPPFLVKTILPDNKSRVYENTALYKHVLALTTIFDKFSILSCKNLNHYVEELVFCVCVCNNYNILFRNT